MAYTKILVIHNRLDKCVNYAQDEKKTTLSAALDYALNLDKTEITCMESAINCQCDTAYADMMETKRRWNRTGDGYVRGYHIIQSFVPGEVTPEEAHAVGVEFAERLLGDKYEVIVATHLNKAHLHSHIVFNSVSFMDGKMYRNQFRDYFGGEGVGIRGTSDAICEAHGLSVIVTDQIERGGGYQSRDTWEAEQSGKPTIRDTVRRDIDAAIAGAYTYKSFLQGLRRQGYTVKVGPNIMHTTVRPPGGKRNIRLDGLGEHYTEEAIKTRLAAVRTGEAPQVVPSPPPMWQIPGRRYRVRGGIIHRRPKKLTGFRALYFKYLYLLGAIRKGRPPTRTAFAMRQDLIQFDRYQRQFRYLTDNRIETVSQLAMQYDALQATIDALTDRRRDLYNIKRTGHGGEAITEEITGITEQLRPLRRELKLCVRIEGDIPKVREHMQTAQYQDRSKTYEKTNQGRPDRDSATGGELPADNTRAY